MQFEELPTLWRRRPSPPAACGPADLVSRLAERSRTLDAQVRRRDRLEIGVALALVPVFGAAAVLSPILVSRVGAAILALTCLAIPWRLLAARRGVPSSPLDRPLVDFAREERERVLAQRRLLASIVWWYLLPLYVGIVLIVGGVQPLGRTAAYAVVSAAVYAGIYALNRRAIANELDPRLTELGELLADADCEPDDDGRGAA